MKNIEKYIAYFLYIIEIVLPTLTFLCMFILFVIAVIARYFFRHPLGWSYELNCMLYLWTGILAICTAQRGEEEHIKFTMFYDWLGERSKKFLDIISKSLVIIFLGISFYPTLLYIIRIKTFSPSLNIPYKYVFSVYLIAIIITIARYAFRLFQDIQSVTKKTQQQLDIK